jgi:DNA polymerase (family 10)
MTARVLKALEHPRVMAMGHPTARMIGSRDPVKLDLERVFTRAAELGVLMEINGQPDRTDLSDVNARWAREKGVRFVIDTDAHNLAEMSFMRYGVFAARRAGLTREDVMNALPLGQFRKCLRSPGAAAGAAAARPKSGPATPTKTAKPAKAAVSAAPARSAKPKTRSTSSAPRKATKKTGSR